MLYFPLTFSRRAVDPATITQMIAKNLVKKRVKNEVQNPQQIFDKNSISCEPQSNKINELTVHGNSSRQIVNLRDKNQLTGSW